MNDLRRKWSCLSVNRWHANHNPRLRNSGDDDAGHTARVMLLHLALFPEHTDRRTLVALLLHDAGEHAVGDMPAGTKTPEHGRRENDAARALWGEWADASHGCTPAAMDRMRLCDMLDAFLWAESCGADTTTPAWRANAAEISRLAGLCGVSLAGLDPSWTDA